MAIKKRKHIAKLSDEEVLQAVNSTMTVLGALLGQDITVSVIIQRADDMNIITNETDYDRLTNALQSIIAHRKSLGPV